MGKGRVVFSGCYYGYSKPLSGLEESVFQSMLNWPSRSGPVPSIKTPVNHPRWCGLLSVSSGDSGGRRIGDSSFHTLPFSPNFTLKMKG